jgi:hypothetical protein
MQAPRPGSLRQGGVLRIVDVARTPRATEPMAIENAAAREAPEGGMVDQARRDAG